MAVVDYLIAGVLFIIMSVIGLSLEWSDFRRLANNPAKVVIGMALQLLALPAIAFCVAANLNISAEFKMGIIILASTPGGTTSGFVSYLLNANLPLSISLTIVNSLVTVLTVPFYIDLGLGLFYADLSFYQLPFWETAGRIFSIVLIPVILGISFRAWKPQTAANLQLGLRWLSMLLLALVFVIKAFAPAGSGGSSLTMTEIALILPASLLVNFLALGIGRLVSWSLGFDRNDQITMGVEMGIQNTSLAFLIAGTILGNQDMLKPALVYATFSFITAVLYGLWIKPKEWQHLKTEFKALRRKFGRD